MTDHVNTPLNVPIKALLIWSLQHIPKNAILRFLYM